jgi:glyoxylase-like metal-dependent hydrolase (beta-lactamase superfamily II)
LLGISEILEAPSLNSYLQPDIGTARCDFPGGSAEDMYKSIHQLYDLLPDDTRTFVGHDYPQGRKVRSKDMISILGGRGG